MPSTFSHGVGPGSITSDGCAVDVYVSLPANGEPELVHRFAPAYARILDLGCGAGRLSNPLADLGHAVVGVDDSADMLTHLHDDVVRVQGRIEELRLDETFDVVLLASNLINHPDAAHRRRLLDACRRHLSPAGHLVVQWHPPTWFDALHAGAVREGMLGPVAGRLEVISLVDGLLTADTTYRVRDETWRQRFTAARLTEDDVGAELHQAGLRLDRWLDADRHWFTATRLDFTATRLD